MVVCKFKVLPCFFHFTLICNMTTFRKEQKWPFDPTPGVVGVWNDSILAFMVLCAQFPLIWYATWLLSVKDIIWPFDPTPWVKGLSVGKIFATMLLPASSALIWYATWLPSEKYIVWPFDPHPLDRGCVCGQNICYHFAASIVSFNFISNMTIFWKSLFWPRPHPLSPPKGLGPRPSNWNPVWYVSYLLLLCLHAKFQQKILVIDFVIATFKYLTFDPLGGVKGGGVKLWHCHSYIQALGNHDL